MQEFRIPKQIQCSLSSLLTTVQTIHECLIRCLKRPLFFYYLINITIIEQKSEGGIIIIIIINNNNKTKLKLNPWHYISRPIEAVAAR